MHVGDRALPLPHGPELTGRVAPTSRKTLPLVRKAGPRVCGIVSGREKRKRWKLPIVMDMHYNGK